MKRQETAGYGTGFEDDTPTAKREIKGMGKASAPDNAQWVVTDMNGRILTRPFGTRHEAELWQRSPLTKGSEPKGTLLAFNDGKDGEWFTIQDTPASASAPDNAHVHEDGTITRLVDHQNSDGTWGAHDEIIGHTSVDEAIRELLAAAKAVSNPIASILHDIDEIADFVEETENDPEILAMCDRIEVKAREISAGFDTAIANAEKGGKQ